MRHFWRGIGRDRTPVNEPIRVLIVEHGPRFARELADVLSVDLDMRVVGSVATADEAYRFIDEDLPDVVLAGTTLPDTVGLTMVREVRRRYPSIATIVVTPQATDDDLFEAIKAGASAYVASALDGLLPREIIKRVAMGEYVINEQVLKYPHVAARLLQQFRDMDPPSDPFGLSDREREILELVQQGKSNREISKALGIGMPALKNYVTSIHRKLARYRSDVIRVSTAGSR